MSTTSCPRCSAQVTLPVGVSNDATVRCPLCHAHYTLADALVNMPPLLEVVGDESESLAADWLDESDDEGPVAKVFESQEDDAPIATALPIDEMDEEASEAETLELGSLELGSLELDDEPAGGVGNETVAEDVGFSTIGSPAEVESKAALPVEDDDEAQSGDDILGELGDDDLTAGPAEEVDLPLDFGEELSAEAAGAETMEFNAESLAEFGESDAGELTFDLDSAADDVGGATIDFGATLEEKGELSKESGEAKGDDLAFDSLDSEGETVRFEPEATGFGGDDLKFDDPLASETPEGDELREFEDLRFEPSDEAADSPEAVPVAPVMAVTPGEAVEEPKGKKGKKEKKKKEKKVKVKAETTGDKPKRSLVGVLVGMLIAIPAALYGALWLGRDYDLVGLSNYLPAVVLPAEYSKTTVVAQTFVPPTTPAPSTDAPASDEPVADSAAETPAEEVPADAAAPAEELPAGDEGTAHTTARPASDDPAATSEAMPADATADEAPSLAEPADAAPAEEMPADAPATASTPAEDDLFAPSTDAPATDAAAAETPEGDPFAPAADAPVGATAPAADGLADPFAPATDAPAAEAPAESDPFAPATDTPAEPAAEPADDLFAPAADAPVAEAPAEVMPAEETPAAPAEDDLFAPAADAPAAESAAPAEADPIAPAANTPADPPVEMPAEAPAETDPFAPAADAPAEPVALPADTIRPAEPDPFAPELVTPAEEMPALEDPADPLTDAPVPADDALTPAPALDPAETPNSRPVDDPLSIPIEPAAPELPTVAPAGPDLLAPEPAAGRVGPRNMQPVSPAELTGAMQSAFVANQQLIAAEAAADETQLRKARAAFYLNLFGMADAITAAQQGVGAAELDPQLQQLATILKQQLAADPRRLESLKVFGARWIGFPKRTTDGVVVSGTVESAEQVGQLFHTKARLGSGAEAPLVTIISAADPQLASGDTVVALGSIVERPVDEIAGYQGSEPSVVWSGMAMKVPAN